MDIQICMTVGRIPDGVARPIMDARGGYLGYEVPVESKVTVQFPQNDLLNLSADEFCKRYLEPAAAVLGNILREKPLD